MASHSDDESNPFAAPQSDIAPEEFEYSKRSHDNLAGTLVIKK